MPAVFTDTPEPILIETDDGCPLELRHHPARDDKGPVLLVHGASAGSDTFRIGETQTLVDYLLKEGFDVWTLDWRAGMRCAERVYCKSVRGKTGSLTFTIDAAATYDVPAAIRAMRAAHVKGKIGIIGHCMGGAIVTQGIAQGVIPPEVENVVITGLGLFYKAAPDNVLKAEDQALEQLLANGQHLLHPTKKWDSSLCTKDPGDGPWDRLLEDPYKIWLDTPLSDACQNEFCHRISYMFGMPYVPQNIDSIHRFYLPLQFGYIPIQFLLHCCQNLRRGYAAQYVDGSSTPLPPDVRYLNRAKFQDRKLTLITGDVNSLWHRDSIDTMYEWLRRGPKPTQPLRLQKHVLAGYGHQDLYWGHRDLGGGVDAPKEVFPLFLAGLR